MYIIKISDLSYKVILSKSDFGKYGTDIFDGSKASEAFFSDIIEKVNENHCDKGDVSVIHADFFEDKFGGGELFLYFGSTEKHNSPYILRCSCFEDIITACKVIKRVSNKFISKLIHKDNSYYLIFFNCEKEAEPPAILHELGKLFKTDWIFIWHLEEHGKILINENAVEKASYHFR